MTLHSADTWTRRGVTLLWQAECLKKVCQPAEVVSVRRWMNWVPSDPLPSNKGQALVVAGLDAVLDALGPAADDWLRGVFKPAERQFRENTVGERALVFWLPDGRARIQASATEERYHLKLHPEGRVALQSVFGGAEKDLERIVATGTKAADADGSGWHGLYLRRNS
jgi:hypothetical protein